MPDWEQQHGELYHNFYKIKSPPYNTNKIPTGDIANLLCICYNVFVEIIREMIIIQNTKSPVAATTGLFLAFVLIVI